MFGDVWIKCQMVVVENPIKMGWFGGPTPIFGNTQMMKHTENTLQSAAYCLLFGNNSWAYCFGFFSFSAKVAYCPFPFAKSRPRMRSERVGAKPVSRLPNVSSSPATISASQKACKALISQIWNMPCLSNCTALAAKTQHVGLACSSHSSSQQCYWPKQKPQPQSKWSRHKNTLHDFVLHCMRSKPILAAGVQNDVGALNLRNISFWNRVLPHALSVVFSFRKRNETQTLPLSSESNRRNVYDFDITMIYHDIPKIPILITLL